MQQMTTDLVRRPRVGGLATVQPLGGKVRQHRLQRIGRAKEHLTSTVEDELHAAPYRRLSAKRAVVQPAKIPSAHACRGAKTVGPSPYISGMVQIPVEVPDEVFTMELDGPAPDLSRWDGRGTPAAVVIRWIDVLPFAPWSA